MMSVHSANSTFFNKKNNDWKFRTLATPIPLRPITSHFCLNLPPPLKVDVICVSPLKLFETDGDKKTAYSYLIFSKFTDNGCLEHYKGEKLGGKLRGNFPFL